MPDTLLGPEGSAGHPRVGGWLPDLLQASLAAPLWCGVAGVVGTSASCEPPLGPRCGVQLVGAGSGGGAARMLRTTQWTRAS